MSSFLSFTFVLSKRFFNLFRLLPVFLFNRIIFCFCFSLSVTVIVPWDMDDIVVVFALFFTVGVRLVRSPDEFRGVPL